MTTNHNNETHDHMHNPEVNFERQDLGARNILLFFAILFIVGVIVHFVVYGVYGAMEKVAARADQQVSPLKLAEAAPKASVLQNTPMVRLGKFPEPRLQSDEVKDMRLFQWKEGQILDPSQPWQDASGAVHIPIEQAMKDLAQKGLPVRRPGTPGATEAWQSNAGNPDAPQTLQP
jgi:hypothetical protein